MNTKVWQCERVHSHTMVQPVIRCTLCGSSVREVVLVENKIDERLNLLLDMGFDYNAAKELLEKERKDEPF